jgi:hypothetical protein
MLSKQDESTPRWVFDLLDPAPIARDGIYTRPVALDVEVQRLQLGDVILVDLPEGGEKVEAKVIRQIERTAGSVLAVMRLPGRDDFVKEWPIDELVTLVRGP